MAEISPELLTAARHAPEVRSAPCPQCLAPPGEVCRTRRGRWLRPGGEHSARLYTAWADLVAAVSEREKNTTERTP